MAKDIPDHEKQVLKREADRLSRDARRGKTWMELDPAAQEVLDDEAAAGRAKNREYGADDWEHHARVNVGMGERPGAGPGVHGHRHGGQITGRRGGLASGL